MLFRSLEADDCILDGTGSVIQAVNTPVELTRTTMFGTVHVKTITAENCIFMDTVKAERRQTGCIRFSFLPEEHSEVPRRYRCQPQLEIAEQVSAAEKIGNVTAVEKKAISESIGDWLVPAFTSIVYGHHGYEQDNLY